MVAAEKDKRKYIGRALATERDGGIGKEKRRIAIL